MAIGLEELLDLERRVWRALVDGDAEADGAMLAADFLGVYPTGFADRDDHKEQLTGGPSVASFELSEAAAFAVADDAVMLCYRADFRRPVTASDTDDADDADDEVMYVSSLWVRRDGGWINVFSQDTPAV